MLRRGDKPVPGFRLEEFLGRGAFGEVWRAAGPGGTAAALKFVSLSGKEGLKEFRAICRIRQIRHANLMPIAGIWLIDQEGHTLDDAILEQWAALSPHSPNAPELSALGDRRPTELVVQMLLGDKDLSTRLRECKEAGLPGIPAGELLAYLEDAAKAIDFLNTPRHDLGYGPVAIQHGDVKPQNIMIVGGAVQLCDFGLARVLGGVRATTGMGGSPAYMAPECILENAPSISSDQYALAVAYTELRTGQLPFDDESYLSILRAHTESRLNLNLLPEAERRVVQRATARNPADRFSTASELMWALRSAATGAALPPFVSPTGSGSHPGVSSPPASGSWPAGAGVAPQGTIGPGGAATVAGTLPVEQGSWAARPTVPSTDPWQVPTHPDVPAGQPTLPIGATVPTMGTVPAMGTLPLSSGPPGATPSSGGGPLSNLGPRDSGPPPVPPPVGAGVASLAGSPGGVGLPQPLMGAASPVPSQPSIMPVLAVLGGVLFGMAAMGALGVFLVLRMFAPDAVEVKFDRAEPPSPVAGQPFAVVLSAENDPDQSAQLEYRWNASDPWQATDQWRVELASPQPGPLHAEFRARDKSGKYSEVLVRDWTVAGLSGPTIEIVSTNRPSPAEGVPFIITLASNTPGATFQYRQVQQPGGVAAESEAEEKSAGTATASAAPTGTASPPKAATGPAPAAPTGTAAVRGAVEVPWKPANNNQVVLFDVPAPRLTVEFRAVAPSGEASAPLVKSWKVDRGNAPPTLKIVGKTPSEPVEGKPFTVELDATDPDGDLVRFEYAYGMRGEWQPCEGRKVTVTAPSGGGGQRSEGREDRQVELVLRFRAIDSHDAPSDALVEAWLVAREGRTGTQGADVPVVRDPTGKNPQVEQAQKLLDEGEVDKALELLEPLLANKQLAAADRAEALYARGRALRLKGELDDALTDLNTAVKLAPESDLYVNMRGNVYFDQEKYDEAADDYRRAIELVADEAMYHSNLGNALYRNGDYALALRELDAAIKLDADLAHGHRIRGHVLYAQRKYAEAAASYGRAVKLTPDDAGALYDRADAYYQASQPQECLDDVEEVLRLEPKHAAAYDLRGLAYFDLEKYAEAAQAHDKACELDPQNALYFAHAANAYYRQSKYRDAMRLVTKALELQPDLTYAINVRGHVNHGLGNYEEAIEDYSACIEAEPDVAVYYENRGNSYRDKGDKKAADKDYQRRDQLLGKRPASGGGSTTPPPAAADADELLDQATAQLDARKFDEAETQFTAILKRDDLDPLQRARALAGRAFAYRNLGDMTKSLADYNEAIRLRPDYADYYNERGNLYFDQSEFAKSVADYTKAIQYDGDNAVYYANRANGWYFQDQYAKAEADLNLALEIDPKNTHALDVQGNVLFTQGKFAEAVECYTRALKVDERSTVFLYHRANTYYQMSSYDEALADLRTLLGIDSQDALAHDLMGSVYMDQQKYPRAEEAFSEAIRFDNTKPIYYAHRGNARYWLDQWDEALSDLDRALRKQPDLDTALNTRGNVYLAQGEYRDALADYDEAIRLNPRKAVYYRNRALCHRKLKDEDKAKADEAKADELEGKPAAPAAEAPAPAPAVPPAAPAAPPAGDVPPAAPAPAPAP